MFFGELFLTEYLWDHARLYPFATEQALNLISHSRTLNALSFNFRESLIVTWTDIPVIDRHFSFTYRNIFIAAHSCTTTLNFSSFEFESPLNNNISHHAVSSSDETETFGVNMTHDECLISVVEIKRFDTTCHSYQQWQSTHSTRMREKEARC